MWYYIKNIFCKSPLIFKTILIYFYYSTRLFLYLIKGKIKENYKKERGMDLFYDAVDWLGGFPYESASKNKVLFMVGNDFKLIKFFDAKPKLGLMGSACSEYVFKKK